MRSSIIAVAAAGAFICMEAACHPHNASVAIPSGIPDNQRVTIELDRFDEQKGTIWLRLHNWTAWDIRIPVEMSSFRMERLHKDGAEASVRYYLQELDSRPWMQITTKSGQKVPPDEPEHPPVPHLIRADFLAEWGVPKDQSVVFQVPKQHLARNIALYVYLRYEWERDGTESLSGPVHLVYYRGIDLPPEVQAHIR